MIRRRLWSLQFGDSNDLLYLAIIAGGMVALTAPILSMLFLLAVATGWAIRWSSAPLRPDDRQDTHDR